MADGHAVVNTALDGLLAFIVDAFDNALVAHLYVNDHTPADTDTLANYTQATFPGYAPLTIQGWSSPTTATEVSSANAERVTFRLSTFGGPYPIFGYYVTDAGGSLLWAARDPLAPFALVEAGDEYPVIPVFTLRSDQ